VRVPPQAIIRLAEALEDEIPDVRLNFRQLYGISEQVLTALIAECHAVGGLHLADDEAEALDDLLRQCDQTWHHHPAGGTPRAVLESAVARWTVRR